MESNSAREFDIIIFGATGFTGQYVIEEVANSSKNKSIKWAVAGRSVEKLKSSLQYVQKYLEGINILNATIIQADVADEESLSNMCKRTKLVLNCVGPYNLYGEPLVAACVNNGTHHIDLSGEFKYLETTQANYFNAAREKGVYIVQACGFDSIPGDYGVTLLKKNFPGDLNSVEYYVETNHGPQGPTLNAGTFKSAVGAVTDHFSFKEYDKLLQETVFKKKMIRSEYPLSRRLPFFYNGDVKSWCAWFPGPDERIVRRSQKFRYEYLNDRPVQCYPYVKVKSLWSVMSVLFIGAIFGFLSLFSLGRYLLTKYPSFFTAGMFTNSGPTRKQVEESSTTFTLIGEGWKDKLTNLEEEHGRKPDTKIKLTFKGPEPGYALTSICMVHAGLTVLEETEKLPLEGGVLTPGVAFENTTLFERLKKRGLLFTFENLCL